MYHFRCNCLYISFSHLLVINSFKMDGEIFASTPTLWPQEFTLQAYAEQLSNLTTPLKNSVIIAVGSMVLSMCLSIPAGYGLARFKIKGMKLFILIFLVTQMLPPSLVLTPLFLTFSKAGILNTYVAPILFCFCVQIF